MDEPALNPIEQRWNDHMADLLEVNPDRSAKATNLVCVFHIH